MIDRSLADKVGTIPREVDFYEHEIYNALELFGNNKIDKEQYRSKFPALLDKYKWKHTAAKIAALIEREL